MRPTLGAGFQTESHGISTSEADVSLAVILSNADGYVIADAVQLIPVP